MATFITYRHHDTISTPLLSQVNARLISLKGSQKLAYTATRIDIFRFNDFYQAPCKYAKRASFKPSLSTSHSSPTSRKRRRSSSVSSHSSDSPTSPSRKKPSPAPPAERSVSAGRSPKKSPPSPTLSTTVLSRQTLSLKITDETAQHLRNPPRSNESGSQQEDEEMGEITMAECGNTVTPITPAAPQCLIHEMNEHSNTPNGRLYRLGQGPSSTIGSRPAVNSSKLAKTDTELIRTLELRVAEERKKRAACQKQLDALSEELDDVDQQLEDEIEKNDELEKELQTLTSLRDESDALRAELASLDNELEAENETCAKLAKERAELQAKLKEFSLHGDSFVSTSSPMVATDSFPSVTSLSSSSSSLATVFSATAPTTLSSPIQYPPQQLTKLTPGLIKALNLLDSISSSALLKIKAQRSLAAQQDP
ncbi:hypothetical protein DL93DRAFT_1700384 [Clavulina sp. PMI_390]|nr:hypothetical protein DL93DRAFT_1700384 [Clavulina sp. PMI_390]